MLTHVSAENLGSVRRILSLCPKQSVRINALLEAYGTGKNFFNIWLQGISTLLARLEGTFFLLDGPDADFEEIAFFLMFNPYFEKLTGSAEAVNNVAKKLDMCFSQREHDFLVFNSNYVFGQITMDKSVEVEIAPKLNEVYDVILKAGFEIGDFMPWYADVSHRIRHGCGRAFLLKVREEPISSCIVSAQSQKIGMLSCIATVPEYRNLGYASYLIRYVCRRLLDDEKLPVLECDCNLTEYYRGLGFQKDGETGELTVKRQSGEMLKV